jgi:hypothetical protein
MYSYGAVIKVERWCIVHENMSVVPVSMNVCPQSVQNFHQVPTVGPLLPYTITSSLSLPSVGPSLSNISQI